MSRRQLSRFLSVTICYGSVLLCGSMLFFTFFIVSAEGDGMVGTPPLRLLSARDPLKMNASVLEEQVDRARISLLSPANLVERRYKWTGFIQKPYTFGKKSHNRVKIYTRLSVKEVQLFNRLPGVISDISRSEIPFNPE